VKYIPYFIYMVLLGIFQVILRDPTTIYSAHINMAALLVLMLALYKGELAAMWFGIAAGLLIAAPTPQLLGWTALVYGLLGLVGYQVRGKLNLESLYSKLIMMLGGLIVIEIAGLLLFGTDSFWLRLPTVALSSAIYTSLVALLYFLVKEGRVTIKKIKALF